MNTTNLNVKAKKQNHFDAIVIGAGMSGSWAAKEFCEKGLKTLVLERGRNIEHGVDYPNAMKELWEFPYRNTVHPEIKKENPIVSKCYAFREATLDHFVKDNEHPYIQKKPFDWIRGYQVGGKSLMWARHVQRWAKFDFEANAKDGYGVDWPIRYDDIAPWYSHVERFAGISGNKDGLEAVPDGEFLPPMELTDVEKYCISSIQDRFQNRHVINARIANLSRPHNGRVCMYRGRCERGCPYGGYFSANSVTIPAAAATGNMTLRPFSVVQEIMYDQKLGKASGVRVIDTNTKEVIEYTADVIMVNAGAINSLLLMMNSTSERFPNGIGNDSETLGHYIVFHNYRIRVRGELDGFREKYYFGRKPTGLYIPRFRNIGSDVQKDFLRGYSFGMWTSRGNGNLDPNKAPIGAELKEQLSELGGWGVGMTGMGEVLPKFENQVSLSKTETDEWGIPLVEIDVSYTDNDDNMCEDIKVTGAEMLEAAGAKNVTVSDSHQAPGLDIHEMGGCRMGKDPKNSMLNGWNQMHEVKNVFVADGSAMTSAACQNPSITFMALTARATNYAVEQLKKGAL
ncbi:MAG: GMC family oxidoreductase [Balneolaceae bacterium]